MSQVLRCLFIASILAGAAGAHAGDTSTRPARDGADSNGLNFNGIRNDGVDRHRPALDALRNPLGGVLLQGVAIR